METHCRDRAGLQFLLMADGFCMRKRIKASAILCSSKTSVEDVNNMRTQKILRPGGTVDHSPAIHCRAMINRPSGTKKTPCPELSWPDLGHAAPAADESG